VLNIPSSITIVINERGGQEQAKRPSGLQRWQRSGRSRDLKLASAASLARNSAVAIPPTVSQAPLNPKLPAEFLCEIWNNDGDLGHETS